MAEDQDNLDQTAEDEDAETERAMQEMIQQAKEQEALEAEQAAQQASQQTAQAVEPAPAPAADQANMLLEAQGDHLDRILAMRVPVIVKIAEKNMTISNVLKLNLGSVITFDKDAYQHVDLMVNNSTIGLGQPVKIGEKFGLRITQIGEIEDMIKSLGGFD